MLSSRGWMLVALSLLAMALAAGCAGTPERKVVPPPTPPPGCIWYDVKAGDTLYSLGRRYGVPVSRLMELNALASPQALKAGQRLAVPVSESPAPAPGESPGSARPHPFPTPSPSALHKGKPDHPFWWPAEGKLVRRFGQEVGGLPEPGIGIAAPAGTEVCAVAAGTVLSCTEAMRSGKAGWGKVVVIRHTNGTVSWYGNLAEIVVKKDQKVQKGQRIGTMGLNAAGATELALRFFRDERPVDPLSYLP